MLEGKASGEKTKQQVSSKIFYFIQEETFRPFSNISTITTSAVRILVCETDVAQGQDGKAQGRSVLGGVKEFICQLNG